MDSVTVSVLPITLALVHIPRHRLHHFSHPLIQHIIAPTPTFLNISCNATEVAVFAARESLAVFKRVAKRDERKLRRRLSHGSAASSDSRRPTPDSVQISEPWSAIQIDSHGDQLDDAGARIREISGLLSGISILYQSSHTTDFIFVQSNLLPNVLSVLTNAGFITPSDPPPPSAGATSIDFSFSSLTCSSSSSSESLSRRVEAHDTKHRLQECDSPSIPSSSTTVTTEDESFHTPSSLLLHSTDSSSSAHTQIPSKPKSGSESPTPPIPHIQILDEDLVVVGLSEDHYDREAWTMKIVKLLLFTDTITTADDTGSGSLSLPKRGGETTTSSHSPSYNSDVSPPSESDKEYDGETVESEDSSLSSMSSSDCSSEPLSDQDARPSSRHVRSDSSATNTTSTSPFSARDPASSPSTSLSQLRSGRTRSSLPKTKINNSNDASTKAMNAPFFSLTRTSDSGTSLTSDVRLLAALFPPGPERSWIYCKDEFDLLDKVMERERRKKDGEERGRGKGVWAHNRRSAPGRSEYSSEYSDDDTEAGQGFLKCLHIDLQAFGLDKHGFVNRFSNLLHSNGISHLYSSTFKTANLLVDAGSAERAARLLNSG